MHTTMRAKMVLATIQQHGDGKSVTQETLQFHAVGKTPYPEDGSDEDNTYARFSPNASCSITVANPALIGKFVPGQRYYVDFIPADS